MPATPMVKRMSMIHVTYTDESGVEQAQDMLVGMDARIFQHELSHLDGQLLIDKSRYGKFMGWRRAF